MSTVAKNPHTIRYNGREIVVESDDPLDHIIAAVEFFLWDWRDDLAEAELAKLDAAGHELLGRLFVHHATADDPKGEMCGPFGELMGVLETYMTSGDDPVMVAKIERFFSNEAHPSHAMRFAVEDHDTPRIEEFAARGVVPAVVPGPDPTDAEIMFARMAR